MVHTYIVAENEPIAFILRYNYCRKAPCMFTFSKRFTHDPESAVDGASFSPVAREFCCDPRDRKAASCKYLFFILLFSFLAVMCARISSVFRLPACIEFMEYEKRHDLNEINDKTTTPFELKFYIQNGLLMLLKL